MKYADLPESVCLALIDVVALYALPDMALSERSAIRASLRRREIPPRRIAVIVDVETACEDARNART